VAIAEDHVGNWSQRVRYAPGDKAFAYAPNEFLVRNGDANLIGRLVPGAAPVRRDGPDGPLDIIAGFQKWSYPGGDVLSAVRRIKASGITAQPVHMFFADAGPGDVFGNPVYGNPVYGNPVYGNPVYGNPVYGNPVYGNPVYGNPVYGNPVYGNPVYGGGCGQPGCAMGAPCCTECDRCRCPTDPPAAQTSFVYPNPLYVTTAYPSGDGIVYQRTGARHSQARPLLGMPANQIGFVSPWDTPGVVRVAVIDTGRPDPAAVANLPHPEAEVGGDFVDMPDRGGDKYLDPVAGHGTFIAGLIARVAPGCAVRVYQALTSFGDGKETDIAKTIEDLVTMPNPPEILSLSFSGYVLDHPACLQAAITTAMAAGIVVVASAGNDGICRKAYPAAFDGVVSVGALGPNGPAPFSNWGSWVRACAPGVDVASTFWHFDGRAHERYGMDPDSYDGWATWSGTSFAAPIVAGVIAKAMQSQGISGNAAVEVLIDQPGLFRIPCYGTVINELAAKPTF
jgi:subtilisin family serine protease